MSTTRRVTGIIPAAGFARRLGDAISGSKEVVPVAGRPAAAHLMERLALGGVDRAVVALRRGKWDVVETLRPAHLHGVELAYVIVDETPSVVHSLAPALRLTSGDLIALAFPDVIFEPRDALAQMLQARASSGADVVLGLFPTDAPERVDMVRLDEAGRPIEIVIKQPDCGLRHSWTIAVWTPHFSEYLLRHLDHDPAAGPTGELQVGEIVQTAIADGVEVAAVAFDDGHYLDIGTPDDLARATGGAAPAG